MRLPFDRCRLSELRQAVTFLSINGAALLAILVLTAQLSHAGQDTAREKAIAVYKSTPESYVEGQFNETYQLMLREARNLNPDDPKDQETAKGLAAQLLDWRMYSQAMCYEDAFEYQLNWDSPQEFLAYVEECIPKRGRDFMVFYKAVSALLDQTSLPVEEVQQCFLKTRVFEDEVDFPTLPFLRKYMTEDGSRHDYRAFVNCIQSM